MTSAGISVGTRTWATRHAPVFGAAASYFGLYAATAVTVGWASLTAGGTALTGCLGVIGTLYLADAPRQRVVQFHKFGLASALTGTGTWVTASLTGVAFLPMGIGVAAMFFMEALLHGVGIWPRRKAFGAQTGNPRSRLVQESHLEPGKSPD